MRAVRATLETLAERIGKDEALHLVPALPLEVAPWLFTASPAQRFDAADFVSRWLTGRTRRSRRRSGMRRG
ncbi:DUF2267 domain-containing protein [Dactylosporangium sp. NPDC000555]|uniref:DUF2267 domain-containing protein n=1 Tax=Dactylosporangium sp. NPDC000555 TaxID=3154260 RepID=UPI00331C5D9A